MHNFFKNKRVAITGVCGTVGSELLNQLAAQEGINEIIGLDNNESALFFMEQKYAHLKKISCRLTDIRDPQKLVYMFDGVDIVFHAAAYKHVILCERSPFEAVQTNINGVRNVIEAARACNVGQVLFTSSDKAVNPTNVMGTSKLMGERLITAANNWGHNGNTIYSSTRFGNVLGSHGSVIPIFRQQIQNGGPVTLTDKRMTRFIMSIKQAVKLVVDSASLARGGEVFVTKMPVIHIKDLAEVMIGALAPRYGFDPASIAIETIGAKPGEKIYEELMTEEETGRTWELDDYFCILPAFSSIYPSFDYEYSSLVSQEVDKVYNSSNETALTKAELLKFLQDNSLLENVEDNAHPDSRYWP